MGVYVDELIDYGVRYGRAGPEWSHMTADTLAQLHAFAHDLGLKRSWFQDKSVPHYDLTKGKRAEALRRGAVFMPGVQQARELWPKLRAEQALQQ